MWGPGGVDGHGDGFDAEEITEEGAEFTTDEEDDGGCRVRTPDGEEGGKGEC